MKRIEVTVKNDYLERMSKTKPISAVAELVWNAVDADADSVKVKLIENSMGGLERITVTDNGQGLEYSLAEHAFGSLGDSWKRREQKTRSKKRFLHGRQGKGRFSAFTLGQSVEWVSKFKSDGKIRTFSVSGKRDSLGSFDISDLEESDFARSGMEVTVTNFDRNFPSLLKESAVQDLTEHFALYLNQYAGITIQYDGTVLDPQSAVTHQEDYSFVIARQDGAGDIEATLTVVEWRHETERLLYLCDAPGLTLRQTTPGRLQAPGFSFSAYLKSKYLRELEESGTIDLEELNPDLKNLLDLTKTKLKDHFRKRAAETASSVVDEWKRTKVYPYEAEPKNIIERTERQVFDVVALNLNSYSPEFERSDIETKKLVLKLLKSVLGANPPELQQILSSVIELPEERQRDLAELLGKTTLQAIINAAKIVTDRLDFLKGVEHLLFDPESKDRLLERKQLHRILASESWVFGEQYHLAVDDESLTTVLKKHNELLGREVDVYEPVLREGIREGIVDLMLSKVITYPRADEREHLVIELKRPSEKVTLTITAQIESYALAVANDERFKDTKTRWVFWVISNEMTDDVRQKARQVDRPEGILLQIRGRDITVWVKTWGELLQECEGRMNFYRRQLEYTANNSSGLEYLKETYEKYLPDAVKKVGGASRD